jgi:hypothetical protein
MTYTIPVTELAAVRGPLPPDECVSLAPPADRPHWPLAEIPWEWPGGRGSLGFWS